MITLHCTSTNSNSFKSNKDQGSKIKQTTKLKKYCKTRNTKEQSFYNLITVCYENVCYGIFYETKKVKAQEGIKKYFLKPVINNPPNDAEANINQTEKTTPIQSQSKEHTSNETSPLTPSVLQPKLNHPSGSFIFPKRNYGSQYCFCHPQWFSEPHWLDYK